MRSVSLLAAVLSFLAPPSQEERSGKELKIALSAATFKKGQYRPGFDFKSDPPLQGWKATVGSEPFVFVDMDGDGALTVEKDGMGLPSGPFIVPIPKTLLTRGGQFEIGFDRTQALAVVREDLGACNGIVPDVSLLTTIRIQSGVRPAKLDPKTSSACEKHLDYLKANGFSGKQTSALNEEDPGKKGYTSEGAEAARSSYIDPQAESGAQAMTSWYQSMYHRVYMVNANLKSFGFALKHRFGMVYFVERNVGSDPLQCHPPDGARDVPTSFTSKGENPNPVPKSDKGKGCGFPILVLMTEGAATLDSFTVVDAAGRAVTGTQSAPGRPANPEWQKNGGCAAFVPSRPLSPNSTYKVKVQFHEGSPPLEWSFTTGR